MKNKIFVALVIVAAAVIAAGPANAGCAPSSKEFALYGGDNGAFDLFLQAAHAEPGTLAPRAADDSTISGAVIGRHWQPGARATTGENTGGGCPDDMWLSGPQGAGTLSFFGSNGSDFGTGLCDTAVCPSVGLIVVIQTKSLDGQSASYTAGRANEIVGGFPAFDFARTGTDWNLVDIPRPRITVPTTGSGGNRGVNVSYTTFPVELPGAAFHAPAADSLLATGTITGYQLMTFTGTGDPGRDATANWVNNGPPLTTTAPTGSITVDCTGLGKVFVATRIVFDGGQFSSDYVSASSVVNCANLANPGVGKGKPIKKSLGN